MIQKLALFVIILLMATPVVAQAQQPNDTLAISISKDFQPFTFLNAEGKPAGMFVDIWRLWAQKTGKQIEFISSDWKTSLENLKNHKADIHSGLSYSPERFDWVSASQPFYEVGGSLFYPVKQGKIGGIEELSGQTVAAIRGSQLEQFLKKNYPAVRVFLCDTREELVKVSREGKTKGFIAISLVGAAAIDRMGLSGEFETYDKILYRGKFHAGIHKKNTELLALVNEGFRAISVNELADIEARWIPDPEKRYYKISNVIRLTPPEEAWLKNHKTIKVGMSPILPPLKFSEKGVIKGIEPDYLNLLSEYTGIHFEYVICDFSVMDAKVKSGEMDMFISFYIPERLPYMTFTEPLMEFKQVIIARTDAPFMSGIGALKGKKVATLKGVKLYDKLLSPYPDIEMVQVGNAEEMFKAVSESKADALISRTYIAGYVMQNYPNLKIAGLADLPPEPFLYAVRKDYPQLVGILNKAIASISKEQQDAIAQKWFSVRLEYRLNWSEIRKWVFVIGGAFTLILGLSLFWNRRLAREIGKRRQTEEVLRESESRFRATFEQAAVGIAQVGLDGRWLRVNQRLCDIIGYSREELLQRTFQDITHPDDLNADLAYAQQVLAGEIQTYSIEKRYIRKDRSLVWINLTVGLVNDASGAPKYFVSVVEDITKRKRAEEEVRQLNESLEQRVQERTAQFEAANKEMEAFTYSVSHDLRAPLRAVDGYTRILLDNYGAHLNEDAQKICGNICEGAQRMGKLIDDLLAFSRLSRTEMQASSIDMHKLANSVFFELTTPERRESVDFGLQELSPTEGDPTMVRQIWMNLISNALKFSSKRERPIIEIGCRDGGKETIYYVQDNGAGFDRQYVHKLFGVFQRLHSTREFEGTGVGLAIVRRIVHRHGGRTWAEGETDKGATIYFAMPKKGERDE